MKVKFLFATLSVLVFTCPAFAMIGEDEVKLGSSKAIPSFVVEGFGQEEQLSSLTASQLRDAHSAGKCRINDILFDVVSHPGSVAPQAVDLTSVPDETLIEFGSIISMNLREIDKKEDLKEEIFWRGSLSRVDPATGVATQSRYELWRSRD